MPAEPIPVRSPGDAAPQRRPGAEAMVRIPGHVGTDRDHRGRTGTAEGRDRHSLVTLRPGGVTSPRILAHAESLEIAT